MPFWPQGVGETSGDSLITQASLDTTGSLWYVHHTGDDANDGEDRVRPLATTAAAYAAASDGDVIVWLSGHTETISTQIQVNKAGLVFVAAGTSGGRPTVKLTADVSTITGMFYVTQPRVKFRNVWFTQGTGANSSKVNFKNAGTDPTGGEISDCYFECGENDAVPNVILDTGASYCRITGTTFVCTAPADGEQPLTAVQIKGGPSGVYMSDVVFDGGVDGFSQYWALQRTTDGAMTDFLFERISLLRGADIFLFEDDTGILQVGTAQGGARVDWR